MDKPPDAAATTTAAVVTPPASTLSSTAAPAVAIYYQRSKSVQEEFKLIELVTERELLVEQLETIIRDVKDYRRELEDDTILETFRLFNQVRDVTIGLLKAIAAWQISFTKPLRPTLLQCDYMVEKIVKHMDFINGSKIRKLFNFQFFRGNALLLPYPNLKAETPIRVGNELGQEIKRFSSPVEADIIACYQVLINSLPDDIYNDLLVPLDKWLLSPWVPRIWISATNKKFFVPPKPAAKPPPTAPPPTATATAGAAGSGGTSSVPASKSEESRAARNARRQSVLARPASQAITNTSEAAANATTARRGTVAAPHLKRRNQMLVKEAEDLLGFTNAGPVGTGEVDAPLSHEEQQEIDQLDLYHKELESLFLPKLGRRSVKTIVVGGSRLNQFPNGEANGRAGTMFFSHTVKKEVDVLQAALKGVNTNAFLRTNAQLIAKRDRILADRKGDEEINYQSNTYKPVHTNGKATSSSEALGAVASADSLDGDEDGTLDQASLDTRDQRSLEDLARGADSTLGLPVPGDGGALSKLGGVGPPGVRPGTGASTRSSSPPSSRGGPGNPRKNRKAKSAALTMTTYALRDWFAEYKAQS